MAERRIILGSVLCLFLAVGCQPGGGASTGSQARLEPRADVQFPPGLNPNQFAPPADDQRELAELGLEEILASLSRPEYLNRDEPSPGPEESTAEGASPSIVDEPPLAAQKAYIAGRHAWRNGDSAQAKRNLEAALRLAPAQPTILRLLGEVYTRTGNRVKGAMYFRQAVALDPADARSVLILGRFAIEKGDFEEAVVLFHEVILSAGQGDRDAPAREEIARYFLASSLHSAGYFRAAVRQLQIYLQRSEQPTHAASLAREQAVLRRQVGLTRQRLGDVYLRLDDPASALSVYQHAAEYGVPDLVKLDKRRVYTALRLGDQNLAQRLVIELVQRQRGDAQSLAMVRYIVKQGVLASGIARELETVYHEQGQTPELAVATADVLPTDQAKALLLTHLRAAPTDRRVFYFLLRYYLLADSPDPVRDRDLADAVAVTAEMMARAPRLADAYGSALVTSTADPQSLLASIDGLGAQGVDPTMLGVLRGLTLAAMRRFDEARAQFESALNLSPDLTVARIELAKVLLLLEAYEQADEVLKPLADNTETAVILLRSHVLASTGQAQQAIDLIDRVMLEAGGDIRLVLRKANLQLQLAQAQEAEQTLLDALNVHPTAEPLYEALLNLYDPPEGTNSPLRDQTSRWRVLVNRLLGTIPNSRTGRLVQAQLYDAGRNYDPAIAILLELLQENPRDARALDQLLYTYRSAGRNDEAVALLEGRLDDTPEDLDLLRMALRFYSRGNDKQRLFQIQERVLMLQADTSQRTARLGFLYLQWAKPEQAAKILKQALDGDDIEDPVGIVSLLARALVDMGEHDLAEQRITESAKRFPAHEADLNYLLASIVLGRGDQARGEQVMRDNLVKHPDHGPSNNGLGYALLMRNEDLEQALAMIQRAVESDPASEAYMDSLGWAYYKLKDYEDAEVWLRKARDAALGRARQRADVTATLAIISDHLGDTLHRLGRGVQAQRTWSEAGRYLSAVSPDDLGQDPELASLMDRLRDKITAVRAKTPVPVAKVAGEDQAVQNDDPPPAQPINAPKQQAPSEAQLQAQDDPAPGPAPDAEPELEPEPEVKTQPQPAPAQTDSP